MVTPRFLTNQENKRPTTASTKRPNPIRHIGKRCLVDLLSSTEWTRKWCAKARKGLLKSPKGGLGLGHILRRPFETFGRRLLRIFPFIGQRVHSFGLIPPMNLGLNAAGWWVFWLVQSGFWGRVVHILMVAYGWAKQQPNVVIPDVFNRESRFIFMRGIAPVQSRQKIIAFDRKHKQMNFARWRADEWE